MFDPAPVDALAEESDRGGDGICVCVRRLENKSPFARPASNEAPSDGIKPLAKAGGLF